MKSNRWFRSIVSCGVLAGLAAVSPMSSSSMPATRPMPLAVQQRHDPVRIRQRHEDGTYESSNWSGYAVTGANGSVTMATGSWVVPAVTCPSSSAQYSSFWVGIDGFNSNTVEQTGTDSDCNGRTPTYYAWFEFYPHASYLISSSAIGSIQPGTSMSASVTLTAPSTYTVTLTNNTTGKVFSTYMSMNASGSSAEWIAEAPSSSRGVLPVADFGTVTFMDAMATQNGVMGSIGSFIEPQCYGSVSCSSVVQVVTMVQPDGAGAQPSGLTTPSSFSDSYVAPPAPAPPPPKKKHGGRG
jgi:peptidase A4-like protein